jgi:membrane-associated phospholipid phosphatase
MMQSESSYVPNSIKAMVLGGAITTALAYFINKRNKISLHAIGMGSLLGFIYSYYLDCESFPLWVLYIIILLGALTASARLYLQLHNLKEILYGYIMSFIIQVSVIQFFTFYNEGYI